MKIIHVDMDAFFASIEQRDHPELRGRPVVVGGTPDSRGVVAAASYEARRFGIRSAMPCREAYRRCPDAVFMPVRRDRYVAVGRQVREIFRSVTDLVEPLSIDEAYLDVTENHLDEPLATTVAKLLRRRIHDETGLTASAGVGPSKLIAKIASDLDKPDGLVVIPPERAQRFIDSLSVEALWGVGPATARRLHALGIRTARHIRERDVAQLERALGGKLGRFLHTLASGQDRRRVVPHRVAKSRGAEETFSADIRDRDVIGAALERQAHAVAQSLDRLGRGGRTVTLKLRFDDFTTVTRSRTLTRPTVDGAVIAQVVEDLLGQQADVGARPVRLVGVNVSGLTEDGPVQLQLPLPPLGR